MKQPLLFSVFFFCYLMSFTGYSQTVYKVDEQRVYSWDNSISDWQHDATLQFTYDNGGDKETNLLVLAMPGSEKQFQNNKTYNASNLITMNVTQFWDNGETEWQNSSRVIYSYDGANKLISETTQAYISPDWQNTSQIEYGYDGSNNLIRATTLYYNPGTMTFIITALSTQELTEYSGSDITKQTSQQWIPGTGWFSNSIFETNYSAPGKQSFYLDSTWNGFAYDVERGTFTYTMGLITKVVYEIPDGVGGWDFDGQTIVEYSGTLVKKLTQTDADGVNEDQEENIYDGNDNVKEHIFREWNSGITDWVPYSRVVKDFSVAAPFSLSTGSFENESFKIFPNPASDMLNVSASSQIDKIELFDIVGKKVLSTSNIKQINVAHLKSGMYLLKAFSNNRSTTKRIVIE